MKNIKIVSGILGSFLLLLISLNVFATTKFLYALAFMLMGIAFLANAFDNQKDKSRIQYYIRIVSFLLAFAWFTLIALL